MCEISISLPLAARPNEKIYPKRKHQQKKKETQLQN